MQSLLLTIGILLQDSTLPAAASDGAAWWQWAIFAALVVFGLVVLSRLAGMADEMTRDRNF